MTGLTRELARCNTVEAQIRGIGTHLWHESCEQRKIRCLEATDHDWPRDTAIIIDIVLESLVLYMFLIITSVFAVIFHHCRILSTSINLSTDYQRSNTYSQQTCGYYIAIGYYPMDKIHYFAFTASKVNAPTVIPATTQLQLQLQLYSFTFNLQLHDSFHPRIGEPNRGGGRDTQI